MTQLHSSPQNAENRGSPSRAGASCAAALGYGWQIEREGRTCEAADLAGWGVHTTASREPTVTGTTRRRGGS